MVWKCRINVTMIVQQTHFTFERLTVHVQTMPRSIRVGHEGRTVEKGRQESGDCQETVSTA